MHSTVAEAWLKWDHFCFNSVWLFLWCYYDDHNYCNLLLCRNGLSKEMLFKIKNNRDDLLWAAIWKIRKHSIQKGRSVYLGKPGHLWKENCPLLLPSLLKNSRTLDRVFLLSLLWSSTVKLFHQLTRQMSQAVFSVEHALLPSPWKSDLSAVLLWVPNRPTSLGVFLGSAGRKNRVISSIRSKVVWTQNNTVHRK